MNEQIRIDRSHPYLDGSVKKLLINGEWVQSKSGKIFDSVDPSSGEVIAQAHEGGADDIDLAVAAARKAFDGGWSRETPFRRQELLLKFADLLDENYLELAKLDSLDYGGIISRTTGKRDRHVGLVRYYASLAVMVQGRTVQNSIPGDVFTYTVKDPIGVVAGIFAWNAPIDMMIWKICPALAAGCTVVIKPPLEASLTSLKLGELFLEAGFPSGVVNIVPGGAEAGEQLSAHPDVDKISFTGSTATGQAIARSAVGNLKRVTLELGGKSPNIVFADADFDQAVPGAIMAAFSNAGQVCAAGTRLFVERSAYDEFNARLAEEVVKLRVGDSLDMQTEIGPLISPVQKAKVLRYIDSAINEGARLLSSGDVSDQLDAGNFVAPTVFADVDDDMTIAREEIFGPVLSVLPFDTEEEVIRRSNASNLGLAGGVWTRDVGKANRMARGLRSGSVWVNTYLQLDVAMPFGGYRMSGYGRESGQDHIEAFLETKAITINNV